MGFEKKKHDELAHEDELIEVKEVENMEEKTALDHQEVEVENEVITEPEEVVPVSKPKKALTKTEIAREKMKEAESLIAAANDEVKEVHTVVDEHLALFEEEKSALSNGALEKIDGLFAKLNYNYSKDELPEPFEVSLGTTKEDLKVSNIGTGRFSGLLLSLLGVVGTAGAWIYFAAQKTGTALDPSTIDLAHLENIPTDEKLQPMFNWIGGGMTGGAGNAMLGMGTLVATSLLVGYVVYKMRVSLKENKNVKVANGVFDKSHAYVENQKESKNEMEKIDTHIQEITPLLADYRVLLDEQAGKLQRVVHVEGELENSSYHSNSQQIMRESDELMTRIEKLMNTSISNDGRVNEASVKALMEAKEAYGTYVTNLYA